MQFEITRPIDLLDDNGHIIEQGWARKPYWNYDREKIKAARHRIKEWDYYYILSHDKGYGITFTISDLGYLGVAAVCWIDLNDKTFTQLDTMNLFPMGKTALPPSSESGDVSYGDKKINIQVKLEGHKRIITFDAPSFVSKKGEKGIKGTIALHQPPDLESMVIATSWEENRQAFYYNQKTNCMAAEGSVELGDNVYEFTPETDFAGIDWGRGNWTYKNRWYWGSASGTLDGESFGWNIGYGFSDRSPASENVIFYKGRVHKLDEVTFKINTKAYMAPWKFTSNDGRFNLDFQPLVDRCGSTNLLLIKSVQHQVFGHFTGEATLDDGTKLQVERFLGFAEDVLNWW